MLLPTQGCRALTYHIRANRARAPIGDCRHQRSGASGSIASAWPLAHTLTTASGRLSQHGSAGVRPTHLRKCAMPSNSMHWERLACITLPPVVMGAGHQSTSPSQYRERIPPCRLWTKTTFSPVCAPAGCVAAHSCTRLSAATGLPYRPLSKDGRTQPAPPPAHPAATTAHRGPGAP